MWDLLYEAQARGASDVHVATGLSPALRIDGDIVFLDRAALSESDISCFLSVIMTAEQREQFDRTKESDLSINADRGLRFRVNAFVQQRGLAATFRIIVPDIRTLAELECPDIIKKIVSKPSGLFLVTGPTGSGKTTTLAAIVDYLNETFPYHIITIEDPVEVLHSSKRSIINQREVHRHTLSFAAALRASLREDPDCILVGELRDLETIRLALSAAETGHLVLATLHTNSAAHTLDRLIDVFPAEEKYLVRAMLSECMSAVVSQSLLKRIGGGRVAAWEVMVCTPAIRNLIREGKTAQMHSTIQTNQALGMMTRDQSLQDLVRRRLIEDPAGVTR